MNSIVTGVVLSQNKKYLVMILGILSLLVLLPMLALFSLGAGALDVLSFGSGSSTSSSGSLYQGPLSTTITYDWGNCTYWAALLRQQANDPIPNNWGNASTWAVNALHDGYQVNKTPTSGSIMQISNVDDGLGHVAYVESVDQTSGAWTISEMNVKGLDIVDTQTMSASQASNFLFIHNKVD